MERTCSADDGGSVNHSEDFGTMVRLAAGDALGDVPAKQIVWYDYAEI